MCPLGGAKQVAIADLISAHGVAWGSFSTLASNRAATSAASLGQNAASLVGSVTAAKGWAKNNGRESWSTSASMLRSRSAVTRDRHSSMVSSRFSGSSHSRE